MRITLSWLREYVAITEPASQIAERLTQAGLEVSRLEHVRPSLVGVITGKIDQIGPHPHVDRLSVCMVVAGTRNYVVVSGAKNIQPGDVVPVALPGSRLPSAQAVIESADIHGVTSEGMLCSEYDLGLSGDHSGVMILPSTTPLGMELDQAMSLEDYILDVEVTPNRPDCLSVIGIAREIAALTQETLRYPSAHVVEDEEPCSATTSVEILDAAWCHRYVARVIRNVSLGQSPFWLRRRLVLVGIRPINVVVDITNYVMWECGQPLHAFDLDLLEEQKIIVRRARQGEQLVTLDGVERPLCEQDLVICDASGPVALAGIMGGKSTEISHQTSSVLLESAFFDPAPIRATSKRLGLTTEASYRFEREVDKQGTLWAANRAAEMMRQMASGRVLKGALDVYPRRFAPRTFQVDMGRVNRLLGTNISKEQAQALLRRLEIEVASSDDSGEVLQVTPPSFRPDIRMAVDVIEEIGRLFHYDRIPACMPQVPATVPSLEGTLRTERQVRQAMVQAGFHETIHYSFVSSRLLSIAPWSSEQGEGVPPGVRLVNPLSEEQAYLRTSLLPSLIDTTAKNVRRMNPDLWLFEIGKVFYPMADKSLPEVRRKVAASMTGRRYPEHWSQPNDQVDFFDLKGVIEALLCSLGYDMFSITSNRGLSFLHPGCCAELIVQDTPVGIAGKIHPQVLEAFELDRDVYVFELDLTRLGDHSTRDRKYKPYSRYPAIHRDLALIVDDSVPFSEIIEKMRACADSRVTRIHLFDVYRGKPVPEGKMSLAFRITYQDYARTMTDEEVNTLQETYVRTLLPALGAQLRQESCRHE